VAVVAEELDLVVLDERVGEQPAAHLVELGGVLDVELDDPPDVDVLHAGEAQRGQCLLDRDALRVEDAGLRADEHAGAHHAAARSSQRWNGSPVMRS